VAADLGKEELGELVERLVSPLHDEKARERVCERAREIEGGDRARER
jgi:hypothetical protein